MTRSLSHVTGFIKLVYHFNTFFHTLNLSRRRSNSITPLRAFLISKDMSCTSIRKSDGDMERQWHQRGFMISTDHTFLNVAAINAAFASDELYWTKEMSPPILRKVISNSFCFGLYKVPENTHDPGMVLKTSYSCYSASLCSLLFALCSLLFLMSFLSCQG
jgi:hypothetical protein